MPSGGPSLRRRRLRDLGAELLEFGVSHMAALVQFRELTERLGWVRGGCLACDGRRRLGGVRRCRRDGRSSRLLGPAPTLTATEKGVDAAGVDGVGASRDRGGADQPAEKHRADRSGRVLSALELDGYPLEWPRWHVDASGWLLAVDSRL